LAERGRRWHEQERRDAEDFANAFHGSDALAERRLRVTSPETSFEGDLFVALSCVC